MEFYRIITSRSASRSVRRDQRTTNGCRNIFADLPATGRWKSTSHSDKTTIDQDYRTSAAKHHDHVAPPRNIQWSLCSGCFGHGRQRGSRMDGRGRRLPPGLNLNNSNGNISGVPTQTGSSPFTIRVTDQIPQFDEQNFTIAINPPVPPTISGPASLPSGTVNQAYPNTTLTASGGTAPLTWDSTVTPALPNGLSWDAATHTISGTPLKGSDGPSSHTFTVRDSTNPPESDTRTYSLIINLPAPPKITTTSLPNGNVGTAYSQQLQATGGSGNLTWTITAGSLPDDLSMDAAGLISGTPFLPGPPSVFTVQVTGTLQSVTKALSITIDLSLP